LALLTDLVVLEDFALPNFATILANFFWTISDLLADFERLKAEVDALFPFLAEAERWGIFFTFVDT
jgi:hypothetical protein